MGAIAGLGGAFAWAFASTLLASQVRKADSLSASALRAAAAMVFLLAMLFILNAEGDIGRMSVWDILQLLGTGMLNLTIGESLYAAAVASIGLTRSFTTVMGTYNLATFLLAAALLGESVTWEVALGAVAIVVGVYVVPVARTRRTAGGAAGPGRAGARAPPQAWRPKGEVDVRLPFFGRLRAGVGMGIVLALVTGLVWGAGAVWMRSATEGFDAAAASVVRMPAAMSVLVIAALAQPESSFRGRPMALRTAGVLGLSGILTQGVSGLLFIVSLAEIGAGQTVVLFSTGAPLWAGVGAAAAQGAGHPLGAAGQRDRAGRRGAAGGLSAGTLSRCPVHA